MVDHFAETANTGHPAARGPQLRVYDHANDFAGNLGRPLTLIATRYPNTPPPVPVDGDMTVSYRITPADTEPARRRQRAADTTAAPGLCRVERAGDAERAGCADRTYR